MINEIKSDLLTEQEVADLLGYKASTLTKNRSLRENHPPFVKIGKKVFYPKKEVLNWLQARPINEALR